MSKYQKAFFSRNKLTLLFAGIFSLLSASVNIAIAFIMQYLIDVAAVGDIKDLIFFACLALGLLAFASTVEKLYYYLKHRYYYRGIRNYKSLVFNSLLDNNVNTFGAQQTGKYLSGLSNDVNIIESQYIDYIYMIIKCAALYIGGIVSLFYIHLWIGLTVIITSILPLSISLIFGNKAEEKEKIVSDRNDVFISSLRDILGGFSVIKSFKAEREIQKIFDRNDETLEQAKRKKRDTIANIDILSSIASILMLMIVVGVGVWLSIHGEITPGSIVACVYLMDYISQPVQIIPTAYSKRKAAKGLIQKMEDALDQNKNAQRPVFVENLEHGIQFCNVSFGYEEGKKILNGVDCVLEKGKSYAIVGISGSGKTTMLNLMMGLYDDYTGDVLFDDHQIRDISMESLYTMISVVQQNVFIFDDDLISNITMYKSFPQEKIDVAIDYSGLKELIAEKGANYRCGEGGSRLSGGERQRVSIARAILKNMQILMMDEATAALDNQTAREVEEAILSLTGITRIVVTHKYNAEILKKYDEILVLKDGALEEKGTFEQLLKANGYFYSLYQVSETL